MDAKKTVAEHMRDVLTERGLSSVMWGDAVVLDDCAKRCVHTTLYDQHPLERHKRILDALERSSLFEKFNVRLPDYSVRGYVRAFCLIASS